MRKPLILLAAVIFCLAPDLSWSQESVRVTVLPFRVHAQESLAYLEIEIPGVIRDYLKGEGAVSVEPEGPPEASWAEKAEISDIRKLGLGSGADTIIWGSLTFIGRKFSLDAKMAQTVGEGVPRVFYREGEGIENLLAGVRELAREISLELFRREKIVGLEVSGNRRIEADAIKRVIKTKPGDVFSPRSLSDDLKAVFAMGYFDDIRIEAEDARGGKAVTFRVTEKPTIRVIRIEGNRNLDDKEVKETLTLKTGSILNIFKVNDNVRRIEDLYRDKNYHNVRVTYRLKDLEHNQADLEFVIEEGKKVRIREIEFEGNTAFPDKKLKGLMKTAEKGLFSFITSSGDLDRAALSQDSAKISAFYQNHGFIQVKVGEPQVDFREDWIHITVKIEEGKRFRVGEVSLAGDLILPREELMAKLKIAGEEYYNREVVRNDVLSLSDLYSDEGYAYADINPRIEEDVKDLKVDIAYQIDKGKQVSFEKIIISGNTRTRDKVIRRELPIYEQELYSGHRLKRGIRNLHRLDYFEDVKVNTEKGSADDLMILKVDVTEKPTGSFSFGGGYSSVENLFVMASLTQRNLMGRGQVVSLRTELGSRTDRYTFSFTEPWLFDIPLSAGFDIYNLDRDYDDYDKKSFGGGLQFSYPVFDFTRVYLSYGYEKADIDNIDENASRQIKELEGINETSSVTTSLRYDSRDRIFNTTQGQNHSISVEYAGLGGNIGFIKYLLDIGGFIPLFKGTVGSVRGRAGYAEETPGMLLPDYERFYLGGINSLRGFSWRDISARDEEGLKIGGDKFVVVNVEFLFPIVETLGLMGVLFYDTGNVFGTEQSFEVGTLRKSAGFGFRWYSPIGPIRIENGYILDPKEEESRGGRWEFSMGSSF